MREILFEYGFGSVNGIVKKVYALSEIPNISKKCDVWNVLPVVYVRQFTGLTDKNKVEIFEGDITDSGEIVVFENGSFKTTYGGDIQGGNLLTETRCKYIKIVSNIHENK